MIVPAEPDSEWAAVSVDFTWGNVWGYGFDEYRVDGEWTWTALRFEQRFGRAAIRVEVPAVARFGGALDSTIEKVHERTGRGSQLRELAPRNDLLVFLGNSADSFRLEDSSCDMGDITVAAAWTLCGGGRFLPAISLEALCTAPSGNPDELAGLGRPVYGGGFMATERFGDGPVGLYLGLLYMSTSADSLAGVPIRQRGISATAGMECRVGGNWSAVAQYLGQTAVIRDLMELSDPMHEWAFGFRRRWKGGSSFDLAVIENSGRFGNSTDLGFHAGWRSVF